MRRGRRYIIYSWWSCFQAQVVNIPVSTYSVARNQMFQSYNNALFSSSAHAQGFTCSDEEGIVFKYFHVENDQQ